VFLLSCTPQSAYQPQFSREAKLVQTISIIKKNISQNPLYQKEPYRAYANQYIAYLDSLIEYVNNHAISVRDASILVNQTYGQFKSGKFRSKQILYEGKELPKKRVIPDKPGAL